MPQTLDHTTDNPLTCGNRPESPQGAFRTTTVIEAWSAPWAPVAGNKTT